MYSDKKNVQNQNAHFIFNLNSWLWLSVILAYLSRLQTQKAEVKFHSLPTTLPAEPKTRDHNGLDTPVNTALIAGGGVASALLIGLLAVVIYRQLFRKPASIQTSRECTEQNVNPELGRIGLPQGERISDHLFSLFMISYFVGTIFVAVPWKSHLG